MNVAVAPSASSYPPALVRSSLRPTHFPTARPACRPIWHTGPPGARLSPAWPARGWQAVCRAQDPPRDYVPFPFDEHDYYKVALQLVQGNMLGVAQGFLLLMREGPEGLVDDQERGLVVAVGGDTLAGIAMEVQGRAGERPLALDLLWRVLTRGREISKKQWSLVRVAVVSMVGSTYIGRIFFGSSSSEVLWDVDARPSDSIWLALKAQCPIYVAKHVWEAHATPLRELQEHKAQEQQAGAGEAADSDPIAIRASDPELVKRMKSELRVLVAEEDYQQAAALRDHPVMALYFERKKAIDRGDMEEAKRLDKQLTATIRSFEAGEPMD